MMAVYKRPHGFLGLFAAVLFATHVAAHPLDDDNLAPGSGVGGAAFVELPTSLGGHPGAVPSALPAVTKANGDAWPTDPLLGGGQASPVPLFVDAPPAVRQDADFASPAQADPLGRALRSVVNVTGRRQPGASVPGVAPPADQFGQVTPILVEEIAAAVLKMEEGLAEVVTEALDARIDEDGRVTFSMLGVEGFHVTSGDGQVLLGHGDTVLAFSQGGGAQLERRIAVIDAARNAEQRAQANTFNPVRDLAEIGLRAVQYPLTWVLVFLALIGKLALVIASSHNRRRSHRRNPGSEQPKVKPARTRVRIKRVRTRIRLQQPS